MYQTDFPAFKDLLAKQASVYAKPLTDELMQAYWDALRDIPMPLVTKLAGEHLKRGKFFPKPFELRPKEERKPVVRDAASDASFREGEDRAIRTLEELRQYDPEAWRRKMAGANAGRLFDIYGAQLWYDLKERCWRV